MAELGKRPSDWSPAASFAATNLGCVVFPGSPKCVRLVTRPYPTGISENEVLLKICRVGICGSDVNWGYKPEKVVLEPTVLGHESSGVVLQAGSKVTHLKAGDRVAIEPGLPCRRCTDCLLGRYNLCRGVQFCATPPAHGTLCQYFVWDADFCYKLPPEVSLDEAALLEPLAVGVHAARRARISLGSSVLILGAGPIGLVCLLTARAMGARRIAVTDLENSRLAMASQLGADEVLNVNGKTAEELGVLVKGAFPGALPRHTIECTGAEASVTLGIEATARGGTLVLVGIGPRSVFVPLLAAACKEVDIRGVFRYANCYATALELVASGKVDLKSLITHRFKLEDVLEAFELARNPGASGAVKIMIHCGEEEPVTTMSNVPAAGRLDDPGTSRTAQ